jgi:predicted ATPase/DNA-binding SARP family transcriptional activator
MSFLGPFEVRLDDEVVTEFGTDKARALLAYLVIETGSPHSRENLAALLWADRPKQAALQNLRQTLTRLGRAIVNQDATPPFLSITRQTVTFNPDSDYWLDVEAFEDLITATKQHRHRRLEVCRPCIQRLRAAVALYRGDLLADFSLPDSLPFDEHVLVKRERLHSQAVEALYSLATYHERRGEYEQARAYAWRQVELEPWREEAHRQLMRALAASGERSAALAQYQTCHRMLTQELNLEPGDETRKLYELIQTGGDAIEILRSPTLSHNLPAQPTPFVGRETELAQIADRLASLDCRLLTVIGIGGSGKTRLALRAAEEDITAFRDGVCLVRCDEVQSVDLLARAIAESLGLSLRSERSPEDQLLSYLRNQETLLVLDSFEHLIAGASLLTDVLERAPQVKLLVTSRERLKIRGEWLLEVKGLKVPERLPDPTAGEQLWEKAQDSSAVQLFLSNARRVRPDFSPASLTSEEKAAVMRICQLVAGNPLAIELAAIWVRTLSCEQIAQEIEGSLGFLTAFYHDVPERHHSLQAAFDHSWDTLCPDERSVLSKLYVFHGGCDQAAAMAVAGASVRILMSLVDKSLLSQTSSGRYRIHGLLKQYAAEKLRGDPLEEATIDLHCAYYAAFLEQRASALEQGAESPAAKEILEEIENVRSAWHWAVVRGKCKEIGQSLECLSRFYEIHRWFREGAQVFGKATQWLTWMWERTESEEEKRLLGAVALQTARFSHKLNDYPAALAAAQQATEQARQIQDTATEAKARIVWGKALLQQREYEAARAQLEQALTLAQATDSPYEEAESLRYLGNIYESKGKLSKARAYHQQALSLYGASGPPTGH